MHSTGFTHFCESWTNTIHIFFFFVIIIIIVIAFPCRKYTKMVAHRKRKCTTKRRTSVLFYRFIHNLINNIAEAWYSVCWRKCIFYTGLGVLFSSSIIQCITKQQTKRNKNVSIKRLWIFRLFWCTAHRHYRHFTYFVSHDYIGEWMYDVPIYEVYHFTISLRDDCIFLLAPVHALFDR